MTLPDGIDDVDKMVDMRGKTSAVETETVVATLLAKLFMLLQLLGALGTVNTIGEILELGEATIVVGGVEVVISTEETVWVVEAMDEVITTGVEVISEELATGVEAIAGELSTGVEVCRAEGLLNT